MSESQADGKKPEGGSGIMLRLPNSLGVGLQGGTVALLLFIGSEARSAFSEMQEQQEAGRIETEKKVDGLASRVAGLEDGVKGLGNDKAKVGELTAQVLELSERVGELEDALACVKDKRRCK